MNKKIPTVIDLENTKDNQDQLINFLDNSYLKKSINLVIKNLNPKFNYIDFKVKKYSLRIKLFPI